MTSVFADISCSKERSCEGCINGNKAPIAMAGSDQVITLPIDSVLLDGSASSDPDGTIREWLWKKIAGPASFTIVNNSNSKTSVRNLVTGIYQFELRVKDDDGSTAMDTVRITVNSVNTINHAPVADAGTDQTITLPQTTIDLDGSNSADPDNNITSYKWTKISGPASFLIANPNASNTQVNNLTQGVYQFELLVTDATALFSKDTIQLTVMNEPQPCPSCDIVFVSDRHGNREIYSCNVDGSNITRLTNNNANDDCPAWSPDGSRIAFISNRSGNNELYIMNADGSNVIRKTFSEVNIQRPSWSPDGTKIAYSSHSNGSSDIWVLGVSGGSPTLLFGKPGWEGDVAWSRDGTKIALTSDWAAFDFVHDIYTINADGTGFTAFTGNIFDDIDYQEPSWSPDGSKLAITIMHDDETLSDAKIGILNLSDSLITVIISGTKPFSQPTWSGDGSKIAYTSTTASGLNVAWVSADGTTRGTIVTNGWRADWKR